MRSRRIGTMPVGGGSTHDHAPTAHPATLAVTASVCRHRHGGGRPGRRLRLDGGLADPGARHCATAGGRHRDRQALRGLPARARARRVRGGMVRAHGRGDVAVAGPGVLAGAHACHRPHVDRGRRSAGRRGAGTRAQPGAPAGYRRWTAVAAGDEQLPLLRGVHPAGVRRAGRGLATGPGHRQARPGQDAGLPRAPPRGRPLHGMGRVGAVVEQLRQHRLQRRACLRVHQCGR